MRSRLEKRQYRQGGWACAVSGNFEKASRSRDIEDVDEVNTFLNAANKINWLGKS
jgi:hypothetical protein